MKYRENICCVLTIQWKINIENKWRFIEVNMRALHINDEDNVAVAIQPVEVGDNVEVVGLGIVIKAMDNIPVGHKISLCDISKGSLIVKYGIPIGRANSIIKVGEWVHTHNVNDITEELCKQYAMEYRERR